MVSVLQVLPTLSVCGGVENYLMNYYRHTDPARVRFTFAIHAEPDSVFAEEIRARGDEIIVLPPFTVRNFRRIRQEIDRLFDTHSFDAVHCHQANAAWFYFKSAKKHGIRHRILHSHQASAADKWTHKLRNYPLLAMGKRYATDFAACSHLAGDWLYGRKPYHVVNNAIEPDKFRFDPAVRAEVRAELGLPEDAFVIGHLGRFCNQKNQGYLLEIFAEVRAREPKARLLLVGGGEQWEACRARAAELGIAADTVFTGIRTDTARMYNAMDVFVMPSLYEGLPVVGVEAQAASLPLLLADTVTKETKVLATTEFLPLSAPKEVWAEHVLAYRGVPRGDTAAALAAAHFDINEESRALATYYETVVGKEPGGKRT